MEFFPYIKIILRGISQVMLQNNALTGLFFLAGLSYNSPIMAGAALLGCIASTFTAFFLKYKKEDVKDGLYGFNGALVGVALAFLFKFTFVLLFLIIAGAFASAITMNLIKRRMPPYTFPFVLVTWTLYLLILAGNLVPKNNISMTNPTTLSIASAALMGFSQVMFQASVVTGGVFLLGILANSLKAAVFAAAGSGAGILIAVLLKQDNELINAGLFGFNSVLCALAFTTKTKGMMLAAIACALSVLIAGIMMLLPVPMLTFPFVAATWITLLLASANFKKKVGS